MMSKLLYVKMQEAYQAPVCVELPFFADAAICETSFTGGEIDPGQGVDWGNL